MSKYWKQIPENTKDHWLELVDPEGWHTAIVKWDGCIHYNKYGNLPLEASPDRKDEACCDDYIHICNLDDHIERLLDLREVAREFFKTRDAWKKEK